MAAAVAGLAAVGAAPAASAAPTFTQTWKVAIPDASGVIAGSSPNVAVFNGVPYALVGDETGAVYALSLASGAEAPGWPVSTGIPVDSTPSVSGSQVFVDAGNDANSNLGGVFSYDAGGHLLWRSNVQATPSGGSPQSAMKASATVAALQGQLSVVTPGLNQEAGEFTAGGVMQPGWPWFQSDSNGATPAVAQFGNGQTEIVMGGDGTAGYTLGRQYNQGGHLRIESPAGATGAPYPNGGTVCDYATNQIVRSSPAVGQFLGGKAVGIVAGTGSYWQGASDTNAVIAITPSCALAWEAHLDGDTTSSPALVDTTGSGNLDVVEGTENGGSTGSVYVLDGVNGSLVRQIPNIPGGVRGGITSVDLGTGHQDLLVPTGFNGVEVIDPTTGAVLADLAPNTGVQDSALVTHDPNGTIGITVAGLTTNGSGVSGSAVWHYEVAGSNGGVATEAGAWPEFHHDPQLTGDAGTPPPVVQVPCNAPPGGPNGYWEVSGDGGIFTFGGLPFCGSTGNITLNRPVVGMAGTRDGGGYWTVASDGGIFAFGDAAFHGSTGSMHLNQPIVGMAATPSGNGYWLVARDGGIFAFGDAGYFGSTGSMHLNQPIVGMAATRDGKGYWLVASDGGIFAYGDAGFHGSTGSMHLNQPVVAIAPDASTGGYWLVAADGGVFAYDAPYDGSTGNLRLAQPIIAAQAIGNGSGYRFEAGDGGVFDFGTAKYFGSEGGQHLNSPVVGSASY